MNHKAFLAEMPAKDLAALTQRRDAPGLWRLLVHFGLILALGAWIATGAPFWWAVLPVQGVLIVFLFTLEHECTHRTPFSSDGLSDWVGRLCGVILILPFEWFRYFHLAHHRYTHLPGKDPELDGGMEHLERWGPFLWHVVGISYWVDSLKTVLRLARGHQDTYVPTRAQPRILSEARWMVALYLALLASLAVTPVLFWVWWAPMVLGQPVLRLYLMAEHGRCPQVADMLDNTRTTYTTRLVRFFAWNMPYHTEHHVLPTVPFHQLPALHRRLEPYLRQTSHGYSAFTAETLRNL